MTAMDTVSPGSGPDFSLPMLKDWTTVLEAAREERPAYVQRVRELVDSCQRDHGKEHILLCPECYLKALEIMQQLYVENSPQQWFHNRTELLRDLDLLFAEAKAYKIDLAQIDSRVEEEKALWYRWILTKYPYFLMVAESSGGREEFYKFVADTKNSIDDLSRLVRQGIGKARGGPIRLDVYFSILSDLRAKGDEKKLAEEIMHFLLYDGLSTNHLSEGSKKYAEMLIERGSRSLEDVISQIGSDCGFAGNGAATPETPEQVEKILRTLKASKMQHEIVKEKRQRLDELQRARRAFEAKAKEAAQSGAADTPLPPAFFDLPVCSVCSKELDTADIFACVICQLLVTLDRSKKQVVYCSEGCFQKGHAQHIAERHGCSAGDDCAQKHAKSEETDGDVTMEDGDKEAIVCTGCVRQSGEMAIYCSRQCASLNLPHHNRDRHATQGRGAPEPATEDGMLSNTGADGAGFDIGLYGSSLEDVISDQVSKKVPESKLEYL